MLSGTRGAGWGRYWRCPRDSSSLPGRLQSFHQGDNLAELVNQDGVRSFPIAENVCATFQNHQKTIYVR